MSSPDWKKIEIVSRGKRVKGRYSAANEVAVVPQPAH